VFVLPNGVRQREFFLPPKRVPERSCMENFSMLGSRVAAEAANAATAQFVTFYGEGERPVSAKPIDKGELRFWMQSFLESLPSAGSIAFSSNELLARVMELLETSDILQEVHTGALSQGILRERFGLPDAVGASRVAVNLAEKDGALVTATKEIAQLQQDTLAALSSAVWELYSQVLGHAAQVQSRLEAYQREKQEIAALPLAQSEGLVAKSERSSFLDTTIASLKNEADAAQSWIVLARSFFSGFAPRVQEQVIFASQVHETKPTAVGGIVM